MTGLTIELARGMCRSVRIAPGTTVLVRHGAVRLRQPPQWLAETWIREECRLAAEDRYSTTSAGCIELTALEAAEVLLIPAERPRVRTKSAVAVRRVLHALCAPLRSIR
ncbi:MAG: hypothetical protein HZC22_07515 [Rhodocyclales bacterium]|nr:hypothetical protein [Rhodocyclales bacterium]